MGDGAGDWEAPQPKDAQCSLWLFLASHLFFRFQALGLALTLRTIFRE